MPVFDIRPYKPEFSASADTAARPQPAAPRAQYVISLRKLARRVPGTPTPVFEPELLAQTLNPSVVPTLLLREVRRMRHAGYTCGEVKTPDYPHGYYNCFKLTPTGDWLDFELYVSEVTI